MKYVASYEKTIQVAEDSWRVILRTMIADETTTLGDIRKWYNEDMGAKPGGSIPIQGITITEGL